MTSQQKVWTADLSKGGAKRNEEEGSPPISNYHFVARVIPNNSNSLFFKMSNNV